MIKAHLFSLLMVVSTVLTLSLALAVRGKKKVRGSLFFFLFAAGVTGWELTGLLEFISSSFAVKIWWSKISYLFIGSVGPLWLHFVLTYTGREHWLNTRRIILLWLPMIVCLLLALTNELHGLVWPSLEMVHDEFGARMVYGHGPASWSLALYSYFLLLAVTVHLISWTRKAPAVFRSQGRSLILASFIPFAGSVTYMFELSSLPGVDFTVFAFAVMALVVGWSLLRQGFLELAPIAYDKLFSILRSGVLVIDTEGRLILANPVALRFLGLGTVQPGDSLPEEQLRVLGACVEASSEIRLSVDGAELWVELSRSPLSDRENHPAGYLYILRNITEQKQREREKEEMIAVLEKSLSEIKRLQGLLPICAHCKKIRNDKGYWEHVELYVSEHSEAEFTHGICPECMEKYYGKYLK